MRVLGKYLASMVIALATTSLSGQTATGIYQYGTFDNLEDGTVNVGNLNVHLRVPVINKPGRGGLNFTYSLAYDSSIWSVGSSGGSAVWSPNATWGWNYVTLPVLGSLSYGLKTMRCFNSDTGSWVNYQVTQNYLYIDSSGIRHRFGGASFIPGIFDCNSADGSDTDIIGTTLDGSQMQVDPATNIVTFRNGATVSPPVNVPSGSGTYTDTNGNQINVSGSSFIDTLGMTALSVSGGSPSNLVFTYKDTSGNPQTVTVSYHPYTVQTAFGCSTVNDYGPSNGQYLVDRITFADSTYYQFGYEATPGTTNGNITGRVASVRLPAGGTVSYTYSGSNNGINCSDGSALILAHITSDGTRTYTRSSVTSSTSATDVTTGSGKHTVYDFVKSSAMGNQTFATHRWAYNGAASGTPVEEDKTCYDGATSSCDTTVPTFPLSEINTTTTLDGLVTNGIDELIDPYGQMYQTTQYDYASAPSPGPAIVHTYTSFYGASGVVGSVSVTDGSVPTPHTVFFHHYIYDETAPSATSGLPNHVAATTQKFNLTSETYASGTTTLTKIYNTYDDAGSLLTTRQDTTNATSFTYDTSTDSFLKRIDYPSTTVGTTTVLHNIQSTIDPNTGLVTSIVDQNSNMTSFQYDAMLRLKETDSPDDGITKVVYNTTGTTPNIETDVRHAGSTYIYTKAFYDGYGRTIQVDKQDSPSDSLVDTQYNADGLAYKVSNPYRSGGSVVYSTSYYDALGRVYSVVDADGSTSSNTYSGNTLLLQDEASKQRKLTYDGAGRLSKVLEPDGSNSLTVETDYLYWQNVATSAPYTYQTIVQQKGGANSGSWRTRTFTYDFMGRLVSKLEPESGTTSYAYLSGTSVCSGSPSLPCSRTDANSTKTTYTYDALNRLTGRSYSGSTIASATSPVTYFYDQSSYNGIPTINNGIGLRTGMSDGSGSTAWSFDAMGRSVLTKRTLNTVTLASSNTFNLDGTVNALTDFSGRVFTYTYDSGGSPTSVYDDSGNTYASSVTHNAAGQITGMVNQMTSGSAQFSRSYQYTSRLLPQQIQAWKGSASIQNLSYTYPASPSNNGNIATIVNGMDTTHDRDQQLSYDNLNRLSQARDGAHWGQSYTYDNWGNLTSTLPITGLGGLNWSVFAGNDNRLNNQTYDSAGEVTQDEHSNAYSYDGEGRLLTAGSGTFKYDGDGYRVSKAASGSTTLYWPSPVAGVTDESDSTGTSLGRQVFIAGIRVWSEPVSGTGVFLFQDHLGSVRVTGTAAGTLNDDIDYLPFGYLYANYGTASANHYRFTDDESDDSQSSTEYATFRNLDPWMGRFNRPDPYDGSYDPTNPQSLNRYPYVMNQPSMFIDPNGLTCYQVNPDGSVQEVPASNDEGCAKATGGGGYWIADGETVIVSGNGPAWWEETPIVITYYYRRQSSQGGGGEGLSGNAPNNGGRLHNLVCSQFADLLGTANRFNSTIGVGVGGSAGIGLILGIAASAGIQVVADSSGNLGLAINLGGNPGYGVFGAGAIGGAQGAISTANTIYDLRGGSYDFGASGGAGPAYGIDVSGGDGGYTGTVTVGAGAGGKGSALTGVYTWVPSALSTKCP